MARSEPNTIGGGPVEKPRPGDQRPEIDPTQPAPTPRPPAGGTPPPPPPPPRPRPQPPVGNGPVIKPDPGGSKPENLPPEVVTGPIGVLWKALHGPEWGMPITPVQGIADGGRGGQEVVFRSSASNSPRKIVWTAKTGAQPILGAILLAWNRARAGSGELGYPTSPPRPTAPPGGTYQLFEGGVIVSHPQAGTHEVHGAINGRYAVVHGSHFGFPTTDETATADGRGRFNHFLAADGSTRSIYWFPGLGAWDVQGPIRDLWVQLGAERGHLGYPKDEQRALASGGFEQAFQRGRIVFDPAHGRAYADPMRWTRHFSGGKFRGDVAVTMDSTGQVQLTGRAECGPPAKFSYLVQTMVESTANEAVLFTHRGKLTALTQEDGNALSDSFVDPRISTDYARFALGSLRVDHRHSNDVVEFLGDITANIFNFAVGSVIDIQSGLILLGASELISALKGSGVAGGARIFSGMMWLAGPNGTILALAADGLARLATDEDTLDADAYAIADAVFKGTLPPRQDIVISDGIGGGGKPFTYPRWDGKYVISLGDQAHDPLGATDARCVGRGQLLVHELTHAWHHHNNPDMLRYAVQARDTSHPGAKPSRPWKRYKQEQQAVIVDEWFARHFQPPGAGTPAIRDFNLSSRAALADDAFPYIRDHVRLRDTRHDDTDPIPIL